MTAADIRDAFGQLRRSIAHAREVPGLGRFLLGRFFYSDAVNTVIVVMSVVVVKTMGLSRGDANLVLLSLTLVAIAMSFVWGWLCDRQGPKRTLDLGPPLVGGRAGHRRRGDRLRAVRAGPVPGRRRDPGKRARRRPGGGPGADGPPVAARADRRVLRASTGWSARARRSSASCSTALIIFLLLDSFGNGAYQVAVLSLLVTMLIGLWLVWPVRDDWAGSGEAVLPPEMGPVAPPERAGAGRQARSSLAQSG